MSERSRESSFLHRTLRQLRSPLHRVFEPISAIIGRTDLTEDEADSVAEAVIILFVMVMRVDGEISDSELIEVREYVRREYGPRHVTRLTRMLAEPLALEPACATVDFFATRAKEELFQSLVELAYADDDYSDLEDELLNDIGSSLKLPEATILQIKAHVETEYYKRKRIMSSSAGLLAALVILFIFVMTATFLRSVF
ncbi:MAG: TerB family tellurite resistance protein, partial [Candidatus Tectomicrobia bacterium]